LAARLKKSRQWNRLVLLGLFPLGSAFLTTGKTRITDQEDAMM
jgi:hypothetical protein